MINIHSIARVAEKCMFFICSYGIINEDDYVTKPFHIDELVARVNAQLRSGTSQVVKDYIEAGDLRLNIKSTMLVCTKTKILRITGKYDIN